MPNPNWYWKHEFFFLSSPDLGMPNPNWYWKHEFFFSATSPESPASDSSTSHVRNITDSLSQLALGGPSRVAWYEKPPTPPRMKTLEPLASAYEFRARASRPQALCGTSLYLSYATSYILCDLVYLMLPHISCTTSHILCLPTPPRRIRTAVNYLSQELYSRDVHFLMELVQVIS